MPIIGRTAKNLIKNSTMKKETIFLHIVIAMIVMLILVENTEENPTDLTGIEF
jgi:hypothetical protein